MANEAPRPEAVVSGRPPEGAKKSPEWLDPSPTTAAAVGGSLFARRPGSLRLTGPSRTAEGTPDRWKLFGSHGQRPWFYGPMRSTLIWEISDKVLVLDEC